MDTLPGTEKPASSAPFFLYVTLAFLVVAAYWQIPSLDFINYDDGKYVYENPHVLGGLSLANVKWAFTTGHASNWHPLTWLSLMLDQTIWPSLYGVTNLNSAFPHMVNLCFHIVSTLLLLYLLHSLTGNVWPAAAAAAIFGLHPAHVESVAWVSERKDVLCAFFWILTLLAYTKYADKPSRGRYGLTLVCFGLGLLSKPMIVSLPIILLALDFWPLKRMTFHAPAGMKPLLLVLEKMPFFALALASCVVTILVQRAGGAMEVADIYPLSVKLENAICSYVLYIKMFFYPLGLAPIYPYPDHSIPHWKVAACLLLVAALSGGAIALRKKHPYLLTGWIWYVVSLLPVIGIVMVGMQARADRYTYIPFIGLSIMLGWGVHSLVDRFHAFFLKYRLAWIGLAILLTLSGVFATFTQSGYWRNGIALFSHTLKVTQTNMSAYHNLADAFVLAGRYEEGVDVYNRALKMRPFVWEIRCDLARTYVLMNKPDAAILECKTVLAQDPANYDACNNMGVAYAKMKSFDLAETYFTMAIQIDPKKRYAHDNLKLLDKQKSKATP